jgi:DNA primase
MLIALRFLLFLRAAVRTAGRKRLGETVQSSPKACPECRPKRVDRDQRKAPMSVVDEVKDRLDIVEVVSSYLPLNKSGRNYKALCPFHSEKTPSFVVFPDSQRWYCFGACNEGGDVFNFVMKMEGWDFRAALVELAGQAGVELQRPTPAQAQAAEEADQLREVLATAARYYHHLLLNSPQAEAARAYVKGRGLSRETVDAFTLGYSLPEWDRTRDYLIEQGYSAEQILKAGLLVERESDRAYASRGTASDTYDRFRGRLMIPIRDGRGRPIGFGARTLEPDGVPKYLNSPKTALFDKSNTLFGLDLAGRAIRREDCVVIAEGYMDVMQAHQAGYENVVAQMGTALTETQLRQLQRYSKRIVLSLDPDAAGVQATLRGVEVAREALEKEWQPIFDPRGLVGYEARLGAEMRVLQLPGGKDPDDVIREDPESWAQRVEEAVPVVDFYLQLLTEDIDLEDTKAKAQTVEKLIPVLKAVANPVEREDYVQKIARSVRVDERAVLARLRSSERRGMARSRSRLGPGRFRETGRPEDQERGDQAGWRPDAVLEGYCLSALLGRPSVLAQVDAALTKAGLQPLRSQDFEQVSLRAIFEVWQTLLDTSPSVSVQALRAALPSDVQDRLDVILSEAEQTLTVSDRAELSDEQLVRDVVVTLLRLRQRRLKQLVQDLRMLMLEAHEEGDTRAKQYDQAHLAHAQTLLRTQRALARSRELG